METIQGIPHIRVQGSPAERGRMLGNAAAERVRRSVANYQETFLHYTGLSWDDVCDRAEAFVDPIGEYDSEILEEMRGIADGAGLDFRDVLAVNVRTEVMYGVSAAFAAECTACGVDASRTAGGHVIVAQNWDWRPVTRDACILLELDQAPKPSFITFLEAGLVGKMGFNSAGIGMMTNLLITDLDRGEPAVPFHVILRGILNAASFGEAVDAVLRARRAASANYLIASADGQLVDLETTPGGPEGVRSIAPESGVLAHANTFVTPLDGLVDVGLEKLPDSPSRTRRMHAALSGQGSAEVGRLKELLADHTGHPGSICRHTNEEEHPIERIATNASLIADLTAQELHIAVGPPCEGSYEVVRPRFALEERTRPVAATG
jgi:isopenicillin-N N-acyltransferase-like protein